MVFNETLPVNEWTCQHLDKIMKQGDWLYTNLQRDNSYPLISDIPKSIWLDGILYEIQTGATIFGPVQSENFTFSRLDDITSSLAKYNIVTIGSHVPAYSCALILDDSSRCFIFDSHSRNENGLCSPDGKATLTQHNKSDVVNFIRQLAESLGGVSQFEMTPVIVKTMHVPSTESDSLDSDAILACNESDFDSDIPLSTYASLMQQVNLQRSERASKQKARFMLKKFDECDSDLQDLGHITDSDATGDEEYIPPKGKRPKKKSKAKKNPPEKTFLVTCNETVQSDVSSILSNLIEAVVDVVENKIETDLSFTCDKSETSRKGRKRTRQEELWADNKRRKARNTGQEYTTRKGKVHRAKALGQGCGDKCRLRCHDKISDSSRELIFHSFWKLGDINQERSFIN